MIDNNLIFNQKSDIKLVLIHSKTKSSLNFQEYAKNELLKVVCKQNIENMIHLSHIVFHKK